MRCQTKEIELSYKWTNIGNYIKTVTNNRINDLKGFDVCVGGSC